MVRDYSSMTLAELESLRGLLLERIGRVPEFRRGSLQVGYRKCGRPSCRCARPGEPGHGPRALWTRTAKGSGGSRGQQIPLGHVEQVEAELASYEQFAELVADYVEVNEAICRAHVPVAAASRPARGRRVGAGGSGEEKGGP